MRIGKEYIATGVGIALATAAFVSYKGYEKAAPPPPPSRADVLTKLTITEEDLTAWGQVPKMLSRANNDLEYIPPNTKCNVVLGFSTGCAPEQFINTQDALAQIRNSLTLLAQSKRSVEDVKIITSVQDSITPISSTDPSRTPDSVTEFSPQRQILTTEASKLSNEYTEYDTQVVNMTAKPGETSAQGILFVTGMMEAVGAGVAALYLTDKWQMRISKRFSRRKNRIQPQ